MCAVRALRYLTRTYPSEELKTFAWNSRALVQNDSLERAQLLAPKAARMTLANSEVKVKISILSLPCILCEIGTVLFLKHFLCIFELLRFLLSA